MKDVLWVSVVTFHGKCHKRRTVSDAFTQQWLVDQGEEVVGTEHNSFICSVSSCVGSKCLTSLLTVTAQQTQITAADDMEAKLPTDRRHRGETGSLGSSAVQKYSC